MTMMILNEEREGGRGGEGGREGEEKGEEKGDRHGQSLANIRQNLTVMNQTQKLNTTVNFINRTFKAILSAERVDKGGGRGQHRGFIGQ